MEKFNPSPGFDKHLKVPFNEDAMMLFWASNEPWQSKGRKITRFTFDKDTEQYVSVFEEDSELSIYDFKYVDRIN